MDSKMQILFFIQNFIHNAFRFLGETQGIRNGTTLHLCLSSCFQYMGHSSLSFFFAKPRGRMLTNSRGFGRLDVLRSILIYDKDKRSVRRATSRRMAVCREQKKHACTPQ